MTDKNGLFQDIKPVLKYEKDETNLPLPSGTSLEISKALERINESTGNAKFTEAEKIYLTQLTDSTKNGIVKSFLQEALNDPKADWSVPVSEDNKDLKMGFARVSEASGKVSGNVAIQRWNQSLGLGGNLSFPLWHSGFWITLKNIAEKELIALDEALAGEKVNVGRERNGLLFNAGSSIFDSIIINFVLTHIQATTFPTKNVEDLGKEIDLRDLPTIQLALVATQYKNGINNTISCSTPLGTEDVLNSCKYVVSAQLDPKKLLFVNRQELSGDSLKLMSMRTLNGVNKDEHRKQITEYKKSLKSTLKKDYTIITNNGEFKIVFKNPSVYDHINYGNDWVEEIVDSLEDMLSDELTDQEKNNKFQTQSLIRTLSGYRHFIDEIIVAGDAVIYKTEDIQSALESLVTDKDGYSNLLKAIRSFISDSVISVVGVPKYICPSCEKEQAVEPELKKVKEIIPIDVFNSFLGLREINFVRIGKVILSDV